jgi:hypothetical protein
VGQCLSEAMPRPEPHFNLLSTSTSRGLGFLRATTFGSDAFAKAPLPFVRPCQYLIIPDGQTFALFHEETSDTGSAFPRQRRTIAVEILNNYNSVRPASAVAFTSWYLLCRDCIPRERVWDSRLRGGRVQGVEGLQV